MPPYFDMPKQYRGSDDSLPLSGCCRNSGRGRFSNRHPRIGNNRRSSFPGLLKTIFELLGLPPLNLMDASAAGLTELFTDKPDFTPYEKLIPDLRVFDASRVKLGKAPPVKMDQPQPQ